jgi:hypothetical protein
VTSSTLAAGIAGFFVRMLDARGVSIRRAVGRLCLSAWGGRSLGGGGSVGASERSRALFGAGPLCRAAVFARGVFGTVSGSVGKRSLRAILALDRSRHRGPMGEIW